jgi:hypothetical protein
MLAVPLARSGLRFIRLVGLMALAMTAIAGGKAYAQASATSNVTATVITPISITKNTDMNFGELAAGATAGTVVLDPAGTVTVTGGVDAGAGTPTAATFTVSGEPNATYAITLPATAVTIDDGAGNTMTVDTFTSTPTPTGTLDGTGNQTLSVGATLNVGANQVAGTYGAGATFDVTVEYN